MLETIVVSHKPKDNLIIQFNKKSKRKELKIRNALHEATFYGKHNGQDTKTVSISNLPAKRISSIVDKNLLKEIDNHRKRKDFGSMKEAFTGEGLKAFNDKRIASGKRPVYKVKIYYNTKEVKESSLQRLYDNNPKLNVKTGGNYLFLVMEKNNSEGTKRVFEIISLFDAAQIAKNEWKEKNQNFKQAIYDYCLKENNSDKVLFTLQQNELVYLPTDVDDPIINFTSNDELEEWISEKENKINFNKRIYKVVDMTTIGKSSKYCFFIPNNYANTISIKKDLTDYQLDALKKQYNNTKIPKTELNYEEFGSFGKSTKTEVNEIFVKELLSKKKKIDLPLIQDTCIKIYTDWLGNVKLKI